MFASSVIIQRFSWDLLKRFESRDPAVYNTGSASAWRLGHLQSTSEWNGRVELFKLARWPNCWHASLSVTVETCLRRSRWSIASWLDRYFFHESLVGVILTPQRGTFIPPEITNATADIQCSLYNQLQPWDKSCCSSCSNSPHCRRRNNR